MTLVLSSRLSLAFGEQSYVLRGRQLGSSRCEGIDYIYLPELVLSGLISLEVLR